jgi:hypothetical protein
MVRKIRIDLENPIEQAGEIAKNVLESKKNTLSEVSVNYIDGDLLDSIISVAKLSKIDDSSLVIKQKIRNLIKNKVRKPE